MFMTEAARGCSRGCTYCVMRRSTNGGMRIVPRATIIAGIPADARRVGLVGAAVTDHPDIAGDRARRRRRRPRGRHLEPARRQADRRARRAARARRLPHADRRRRRRERADAPRRRALDARRAPAPLRRARRGAPPAHAEGLHDARRARRDRRRRRRAGAALAASSRRSTRGSRTASRRSSPSATRRSTARRSPASTSSRRGSRGCATGLRAAGLARQGRGAPDVGALGVGRVHARAGRDARRGSRCWTRTAPAAASRRTSKAFAARGVEPTGPRARVPSSAELIALRRAKLAGAAV